jgi:hypothetical protein
MALQLSDLIAPTGLIAPFLFPKPTLEESTAEMNAKVDGWLAASAAQVATVDPEQRENAQRAWVYWRVYDYVVQEMHRTPNQAGMDGGKSTVSFTDEQRAEFRRLRDKYEAEFNDYLPSVDTPSRRSYNVTLQPRWR